MKDKGITQKELYQMISIICKTKVTLAMLSRIISGKQKNVHCDTLIKICVALGVSPNDILDAESFKYLFNKSFIEKQDAQSIFE
jgi:DNA-binding Xre family transcriptional regulator